MQEALLVFAEVVVMGAIAWRWFDEIQATMTRLVRFFEAVWSNAMTGFALMAGKSRVSETSDHDPREPKPAKQRYVDGEIDELELERELEDELTD